MQLFLSAKQSPEEIDEQKEHQSCADCGEKANDGTDDAKCAENKRKEEAQQTKQEPDG